MKISVVISAHNEEEKIKECLESVKWTDEIIVVDNSSTDNTAKVAKQFTKHVFHQKNDPLHIDLQKNFGIEKARGDWILLLDADERVTPELAAEIRKVINIQTPSNSPLSGGEYVAPPLIRGGREGLITGYWIPRKNIIFGKWIAHSGWYPDYQLRLFQKGKGKYVKTHYHEPLQLEGESEKLQEHLLHYNYESISQFFHRNLEQYAPNEAEELLRSGYKFTWTDAIRFPLKEFLSRYFARDGYRDGLHGLVLGLLMSIYHFAVFCYLWEKVKFVEAQVNIDQEFKKAGKEISYWVYTKKINEEKKQINKMGLRVKRKLQM